MQRLGYYCTTLFLGSLLSISTGVQAHYPVMSCALEQKNVLCQTGFSDGSQAINKRVKVLDYNDQLLLQLKTDHKSQVSFLRPEGEFYIRFDSGHESPIEIDYDEL